MSSATIIQLLKKIKKGEAEIASIEAENSCSKKLFDAEAKRLQEIIARSVYDNMTDKQKEEIEKHRALVEEQKTSDASYIIADKVFDPMNDEFEILSIDEENGKVRFEVEYVKNRRFLGIVGAWMPDVYYSGWIDEDILK